MLIINVINSISNKDCGKTSLLYNLGKTMSVENKMKVLLIDCSINNNDLMYISGFRNQFEKEKIYEIKKDLSIMKSNIEDIDIDYIYKLNYDIVLIDYDNELKYNKLINDSNLILYITDNIKEKDNIEDYKNKILLIQNKYINTLEENNDILDYEIFKINNYKYNFIYNLFDIINNNKSYKEEIKKLSKYILLKCNYNKDNIIYIDFKKYR